MSINTRMGHHHALRRTSCSGDGKGKHQNPGNTPRWGSPQIISSYHHVISGLYWHHSPEILLDNPLTMPNHSNANHHEHCLAYRKGKPLFRGDSLEARISVLMKIRPRNHNPVCNHCVLCNKIRVLSCPHSNRGAISSPAQRRKG